MFNKTSSLLTLLLLLSLPSSGYGQETENGRLDQLLFEQRYDDALPILKRLYREYPDSEHHLDRLIHTLVLAGRAETALAVVEQAIGDGVQRGARTESMRAELLHRTGRRDEAIAAWRNLQSQNRDNIALIYQIGNAMVSRGEFEIAVDHYERGRRHFNNATLFGNEIIAAWLQAGETERAVSELIELAMRIPSREGYVRQRIRDFRDPQIVETAIGFTENRLREIGEDSPHYPHMRRFLLSLYIDSGMHERAVREALSGTSAGWESQTLLSLAESLETAHEVQLAEELYLTLIRSGNDDIKPVATERLARLYHRMADNTHLSEIESPDFRISMYKKAFDYSLKLLHSWPDYERTDANLWRLATISTDVLADVNSARTYLERLKARNGELPAAEIYRLEGRILRLEGEWRDSRYAFQRALEQVDRPDMTDLLRFELGKTEFFEGDPEYALLQLRQLENVSDQPVAANALRIRLWIQEGLRADTTGQMLRRFTDLIIAVERRDHETALRGVDGLLESGADGLAGFALAELATHPAGEYAGDLLRKLEQYNSRVSSAPVRERLLWLEFQLADHVWRMECAPSDRDPRPALLERLVREFPRGFYAPHARRELQRIEGNLS